LNAVGVLVGSQGSYSDTRSCWYYASNSGVSTAGHWGQTGHLPSAPSCRGHMKPRESFYRWITCFYLVSSHFQQINGPQLLDYLYGVHSTDSALSACMSWFGSRQNNGHQNKLGYVTFCDSFAFRPTYLFLICSLWRREL